MHKYILNKISKLLNILIHSNKYNNNTCYCNNIAPGETTRTCRKVGAHQKALRLSAQRSLAQREYYRIYNRLKQRKNRGQISVDEWNTMMTQARELVDQVERGELTYDELVQRLNAL